jgi:creatinine amidohydrolase
MKCPMLIDQMTWTEIRDRIAAGCDTIIVPLGAIEQHGPALPLLTDNAHGLETALRAARILGDTLVGPVVTMGYSPEHTAFPGTVSLSAATLSGIIHDIAESHARSGFRLIYFWLGHGGDYAVLQSVLRCIERKWPRSYVTGLKKMDDFVSKTWAAFPGALGIPPAQAGSHAGEIEASMMLSTVPDLVRMDEAEQGSSARFDEIEETMYAQGIQAISPNGVIGDQRAANAERGDYYLEQLAGYLVADVQNEKRRANP